jgi:hypothetical protein
MGFDVDMDYLFTNRLATHLADRKNLERLIIHQDLRADITSHISAHVESPFAALQKLSAVVPSDSVPLLVPMLGNVATLELSIHGDASNVLGPIPSFDAAAITDAAFQLQCQVLLGTIALSPDSFKS